MHVFFMKQVNMNSLNVMNGNMWDFRPSIMGIFGVGKSDDIFNWNMEKEHSTSRSYRRYNMKTVWTHLVWHLSIF